MNCFYCQSSADHELAGVPDRSGLCDDCWTDRHHNGVEDTLWSEGVLTPAAAADLQSHFYDTTECSDTVAFSESMAAVIEEVPRMTPLRLGSAEELARHAGVGSHAGQDHYDVVEWPGAESGTSLYATMFVMPIDGDLPIQMAGFVSGKSPTAVDESLDRVFDEEIPEMITGNLQ